MNICLTLGCLEVYVFLFLILFLTITGSIGLLAAIRADEEAKKLKDFLYKEREKTIALNRENMRLKLKCGELKAGEKVDV